MNDKLARWITRINQKPSEQDPDYEDFIEMLVECRIIEDVVT